MKQKITGVVFASGKGSRLESLCVEHDCPKHLLPLGKSFVVGRAIQELSGICEQVICIAPPDQISKFKEKFSEVNLKATVVPKVQPGFHGDFAAAANYVEFDQVIITAGDLIFPEHEIEKFVERASNKSNKFIIAFDKDRLKVPRFPAVDFRLVLGALPKSEIAQVLHLDPESYKSLGAFVFNQLIKNKVSLMRAQTLFNINTPEDYQQAFKYFKDASA